MEESQGDDKIDLLAAKDKLIAEKKMIPALDIKSIETMDSLTFAIILH